MNYAQRYECRCGESKVLPEHPETGKRSVRTGCPGCARITSHFAVGRSRRAIPVEVKEVRP